MRVLPAALLVCLIASPAAIAQTPANTPSAAAAPITAAGKWRASKVIGVNVYNEQNEKVGDISDVIIDSGRPCRWRCDRRWRFPRYGGTQHHGVDGQA